MRFGEFVRRVQSAGWRSSNDAQHTNIRKVWEECFPDWVQFEHELKAARDSHRDSVVATRDKT